MALIESPLAVGAGPSPNEQRIIDATLRCVARWGIGKTTLDDIASEAGLSRATIYRVYPGGKDVIFTAVLQHEVGTFFIETSASLESCDTLADLLESGLKKTNEFVHGHDALGFLLEHETDLLLTHLAAHRLGPVVLVAELFAQPHLARFIGYDAAAQHAEWVVRNVLSYTLNPSPDFDLSKSEDLERLVAVYFLPVLSRP